MPGQTREGVDPRASVAGLAASQSGQLRWTQIDQTTAVTTTVALTDKPSGAHTSCSGGLDTFDVPIVVGLRTDDGKLNASLALSLNLERDGTPITPTTFASRLSKSTLVGTGVVSDTVLEPENDQTAVDVLLKLAATTTVPGAAFSEGSIRLAGLTGRDVVPIADMTFTP